MLFFNIYNVSLFQIVGLKVVPKSVTLVSTLSSSAQVDAKQVAATVVAPVALQFYYDSNRQLLTIKKPDAFVTDDWNISLEY
jgi:hypothetical protein